MPEPHKRGQKALSISLCFGMLVLFGQSKAVLDLEYEKTSHCPTMALSSQHRFQTYAVRSLLQCLSACRASAACVSVVHERALRLCHLGSSPAMENCSNMEPSGPDISYYEQKVGIPVDLSIRSYHGFFRTRFFSLVFGVCCV